MTDLSGLTKRGPRVKGLLCLSLVIQVSLITENMAVVRWFHFPLGWFIHLEYVDFNKLCFTDTRCHCRHHQR